MNAKTGKLTPPQREALRALADLLTREGFYLAGGTGLLLQLDHRSSQDLDWFRSQAIDPIALTATLQAAGIPIQPIVQEPNTLYFDLFGVPASVLRYNYPLLLPVQYLDDLHCNVASLLDIACMKLSAIVQRSQIKDYYDLAVLARTGVSLAGAIRAYREKFGGADPRSAVMALTYFDDVSNQTSAFAPIGDAQGWDAVQRTLVEWVREFHRQLALGSTRPAEQPPDPGDR